MKRIITLLSILLIGCNSRPNTSSILSKHHYDDIDIFSMKGIRQLNENNLKYPCFEIDSINENQRDIIFRVSYKDMYSRQYKRGNNYWLSIYNFSGDTSNATVYSYIQNKKMIELSYSSDSNYSLISMYAIDVFENNIKTIYLFEKPIKVEPSIDYKQFLNNKISGKVIEKYVIKDNMLKVVTERKNGNEDRIKLDSSTYNLGQHSIFWWFYFK